MISRLASLDGGLPSRNDDGDNGSDASGEYDATDCDDNGSRTGGSGDTTTGEAASTSSSSHQLQHLVPKEETNAVRRTKALVYAVLLLATAAIGTLIYCLTSSGEWQDCQLSFHEISKSLAVNGESNAAAIFNHVKTLATSVTSAAVANNLTFPNVTLPNFDARAREAKDLSGIQFMVFAPIVNRRDIAAWEAYAASQHWLESDLKYYPASDHTHLGRQSPTVFKFTASMDHNHHGQHDQDDDRSYGTDGDAHGRGLYSDDADFVVPLWQLGPVPMNASIINLDMMTYPPLHDAIAETLHVERKILSGVMDLDFLLHSEGRFDDGTPRSVLVVPVREDFTAGSKIVGFVFGVVKWAKFFEGVLPTSTEPIIAVVEDPCGSNITFRVVGDRAEFLGYNGTQLSVNSSMGRFQEAFEFAEFARDNINVDSTDQSGGHSPCEIILRVYSTSEFDGSCTSNGPALYTTSVVMVFFIAVITFTLYDFWVIRRQRNLLTKAKRTDAIVTSLFPRQVQQRIMEDAAGIQNQANSKKLKWKGLLPAGELVPGLDGDENARDSLHGHADRPIADLYSEATIMFADIVGFTEWSSCRVPSDVFTLLESIFSSFDQVAARRRVFKVETVGDCYVASCDVPEPRKDHALVMARFARDCLVAFHDGVRRMERTLGPDTGALGIRIGIHSGPVTAGVLRGERSRFQLFGDTMNTCSRIESTGSRNRIHVSQETAELLKNHGKGHWCRKREDAVTAKGKGCLTTFWLEVKDGSAMSSHSSETGADDDAHRLGVKPKDQRRDVDGSSITVSDTTTDDATDQTVRLVKWNADILTKFLKEVVVRRVGTNTTQAIPELIRMAERELLQSEGSRAMPLNEVAEAIRFTRDHVEAPPTTAFEFAEPVLEQLHSFLLSIALLYRNNPFHCFEHATHVTMSVVKLLSRITGVDPDPLTQFAVVLSALIHDVDHRGVPNSQLANEGDVTAAAYGNRSPAEQNSIDIAWSLLMQDEYQELRDAIYTTPDELRLFRQVVVNTVMATDIMDKELGMARKARWIRAFGEADINEEDEESAHANVVADRKATVVLEHLIQASDVAHTMQHWNIYRKWNSRYFTECYRAYLEGRADTNPADNWYEGELGFFDYYIIPLAQKLKDCGVFGVSSDEYLVYAQRNRREWENRGREEVEAMVAATQANLCRVNI